MKTSLLKGVPKDNEGEVKAWFKESVYFRNHLIKVLEDEIETLHASMRDEDMFESPNWSLKQADRVAQVKAIRRVISLLK